MSTCLGIYIENNLIKYAKLSKENDIIKVEAFNIKFYDKLEETLEQIISETYSYRTPISINLSNETYNYFRIFSLLSKKDIKSVINTEFESICYENGKNKEAYDTRYILVKDLEDKEKIKAIHVSANKTDLARKTNKLEKNRITSISPIGISITNLLEYDNKENVIIVNIEDKTTITTIIDKNVYNVDILEEGTEEIFQKINQKENSYSKAYEICKSATLYTSDALDLNIAENDYLDEIMPTLYEIAGKVRKIINENMNKIDKVYITGTASVINNIDIYFQDYLNDTKCEILRPYFLKNLSTNVNIKDYIEVNSAIALALQGLGEGIKEIDFKKSSKLDDFIQLMNTDIGGSKKTTSTKKKNFDFNFDFDFKTSFSKSERAILRTTGGILLLLAVYTAGTMFINNEINKKSDEVKIATVKQEEQIVNLQKDKSSVDARTNEYAKLINNLEAINKQIANNSKTKNSIPTLLNQIMFVIPKNVQLTSIQNTEGTHIVINAEAKQYEQLGYFKAILKTENILTNVTSDSAIKENGVVKVKIEGDII